MCDGTLEDIVIEELNEYMDARAAFYLTGCNVASGKKGDDYMIRLCKKFPGRSFVASDVNTLWKGKKDPNRKGNMLPSLPVADPTQILEDETTNGWIAYRGEKVEKIDEIVVTKTPGNRWYPINGPQKYKGFHKPCPKRK